MLGGDHKQASTEEHLLDGVFLNIGALANLHNSPNLLVYDLSRNISFKI